MIREGIDLLLPVAQVGGEIVGAWLLSQQSLAPSRAGTSVIELLTQVTFLAAGLGAFAWLTQGAGWK